MPLLVFAPEIAPSPGGAIKPQLKLLTAEFGDGYSQSIPNGLNHIRRMIDLKWDALIESQKIYIDDFFTSHGGTKTFLFQPFGVYSMTKWTCKDWSISPGAPWGVQAKLEESFYQG